MSEESKNQFIESFKKRLETVTNKDYLIQNEINQIEAFTSIPDKDPNFVGELNFANETNSVFDLMHMGNPVYFNSVFNEYLMEGKVTPMLYFDGEAEILPDEELPIDEDDIFGHEREEAIDFVKYYLWLRELKDEPKKTPKSKISQLTHKQKILALHYLGFDLSKFDNKKTAKVLSQILGVGEENTRKYLSYVYAGKNDVRTIKNLKAVSQLFENAGITEVSNKIKSDLEK